MNLEAIKKGRTHTATKKWPGTECDVVVALLNMTQMQQAKAAADSHCRELFGEYATENADDWQTEVSVQVLFLALQDAETGKPIAENIDAFRAQCSNAEISALAEIYNELEQESDPAAYVPTEEELEDLLDEITKKPTALASFSNSILLKKLLHISVSRPASCQNPSCSCSTLGIKTGSAETKTPSPEAAPNTTPTTENGDEKMFNKAAVNDNGNEGTDY